MYIIALKMLLGDKSKYIAMVVGISFASPYHDSTAIYFLGLLSRTFSFIRDVPAPNIWVTDPGVQFVEEHKPMRDTTLYIIRGIEGIDWAVPLYKALVIGKLPDGQTKTMDLNGLDDATLVGAPHQVIQGRLEDLRQANAVMVDYEAARTLLRVKVSETETRPLAIGDRIEINDQEAIITGYVKTTRNFVLQPRFFTTYSKAISYAPPKRRQLTYVLAKTKPGINPEEVCKKINSTTQLTAYTADSFSHKNLMYWMKNTGIPINFGISVLLGFIVGAAVVGQTFFNFVHENSKHYAALKAMGLSQGILIRMVLLQAFVVGFTGYGIGLGLTSLFGIKMHDTVLAFLMPPVLLLFSSLGIFLIVMISALLGIRRVLNIDPSSVFRS